MPKGEVVDGADGRPLAGVPVSDGLTVVRTRDDGHFEISARADAEFVWVSVPSTHQALRPGWFADVRGGAASLLRFELEPRPSDQIGRGCRFVQITDLHVSVDAGARLRPMIEAGVVAPPGIDVTGEVGAEELRADLELIVERAQPDFVVATGDLADYGQREELEAYRDAITGVGVPVASVPGNHDHLSCLTRQAIEEFFGGWSAREDTEGLSASDAFQREVFGGDWRRAASGRVPWVETIGPLYYSFDWGGVHFVAYDGEGLRRYGTDYPQDEWLAADLATVARDTPVVVCTHFPETREFFRTRFGGVRLIASFSGHWHGTRLWEENEGRHWTSSTLGFGGIDFTPRGYRVVDVDRSGARTSWETIEANNAAARVTGVGGVVDGAVVVAFESSDTSGCIAAVERWTRDLPIAARGGVAVGDGLVCAIDLGATVHALDGRTGATRWSRELGDASVRWVLGAPAIVDDRVYVGSAMAVHALDARDGAVLWRTDLSNADWAASWSGVAARDDTVVVGAASDNLHLAALDPATGVLRWDQSGRDITGVTATPAIVDHRVLTVRAPGWLVSSALSDGTEQWRVPLDDAWPVALTVADDVAFVRSSTGVVSAHSVDNGATRWTRALGAGVRAGRPYARTLGGTRLPLVVIGDRVWTAGLDTLIALDVHSGDVVTRADAGAEIATVVAFDDSAVAVTVDGRVVHANGSS